jgi:hypothetical protein
MFIITAITPIVDESLFHQLSLRLFKDPISQASMFASYAIPV